jgi:hypothetical protein
MLCVNGMAMIVVKAGTASVRSDHAMSWIDSRKMTAPIRHRMGPVAIEGMELKRGLQRAAAAANGMFPSTRQVWAGGND